MKATTLFHVTYYSKCGRIVLTETIRERDYWDACTRLLGTMPPQAADFDVEEVESGLPRL
jgi:hypothetical protein